MFGSTQCNWDCAFVYKTKKGADVSQRTNKFFSKHICVVKENTNYSYAAMEEIARNSFLDRVRSGDRIPASTMAITNVSGFLEMDSWVAAKGAIGMGPIPVLNGAIFTFDGATQRVTSSNKLEILVTIKLGNDGRKNVDHLETTGEAAKPEHARHFSDYAAKAADANDIPWWLFGS